MKISPGRRTTIAPKPPVAENAVAAGDGDSVRPSDPAAESDYVVDRTTPATKGQLPPSVGIITENDVDRIADCIESILRARRSVPAFEVILLKSASTDRTRSNAPASIR